MISKHIAQDSASTSLPLYYSERNQPGEIVKQHSGESYDALLNSPAQPRDARHHREPPQGPLMNPIDVSEIGSEVPTRENTRRIPNEVQRWGGFFEGRRSGDYGYRGYGKRRRFDGPYYPDYRGPEREPYPEYYEDDRRPPRAYHRSDLQRYSTRPPPAHRNLRSEEAPPGPAKVHYEYDYPSEEEDPIRPLLGGKGGGRRPPSTDEVLRLPWTM